MEKNVGVQIALLLFFKGKAYTRMKGVKPSKKGLWSVNLQLFYIIDTTL